MHRHTHHTHTSHIAHSHTPTHAHIQNSFLTLENHWPCGDSTWYERRPGSFYHVVMLCFGNLGNAGGISSSCHVLCHLYCFPGVQSQGSELHCTKTDAGGHLGGLGVRSQRQEVIMGWPKGIIPFLLHSSPMKQVL